MDKAAIKLFDILYGKCRGHDDLVDRLKVLMNVEYSWIVDKVMSGQCPFCSKQFDSTDSVLRHIMSRDRGRNLCFYATVFLVLDLIRGYSTILEIIEWRRYRGSVKYFVKLTGKWYNSFDEAYHALKNHIISSIQHPPTNSLDVL